MRSRGFGIILAASAIAFLVALAGVRPSPADEAPPEGDAAAPVVPGAADPAFRSALDDWLADNDATALPALAALAADGNRAAQILLSLIDRMPETHSVWVAGRTRAERRVLMRQPDGRAWIDQAAQETELARLWLEVWHPDGDPAAALAFADLGEARAARLALLAHAARERGGFADLADDPRYPDEVRYLAWAETRDAPETASAIAARAPGDPQVERVQAGTIVESDLLTWLRSAALAAPVARFCESACTDDVEPCVLGAYRALGGYRGLLGLGSPSETLVPAEVWLDSAKGLLAVPRRIAVRRTPDLGEGCLARTVAIAG